jgi:hypothetical protein
VARRVHRLQQRSFLSFEDFDFRNNFTHHVLACALSSTNAFCHVDTFSQLTLFGLVAVAEASLTHSAFVFDERVLLGTLILNQAVLKGHFTVKVSLRWLPKNVFFPWQFGHHRLKRKRYFVVLRPVHVVILVDPRVLVLGLLLSIGFALSTTVTTVTTITTISTTTTATTTATVSTTAVSLSAFGFLHLGVGGCLSTCRGSSTTVSGTILGSRGLVGVSSSTSTAAFCLGSGVVFGSCGVSVGASASSHAGLLLFFWLRAHILA